MATAATILPFISAMPAAEEVPEPESGVQQIGPGQYFPDTSTFEVGETDVSVGAIGRRHRVVAATDGGLARPQAVSRPDLAVYGLGWEAEFLGGATGRSLTAQGDTITTGEIGQPGSIRYDLKSSVTFPGGGGVRKLEAADGSKLSETTRWDSAAGVMRTTITETPAVNFGPADDGIVYNMDEFLLTYTWVRVDPADPASWRVTPTRSSTRSSSRSWPVEEGSRYLHNGRHGREHRERSVVEAASRRTRRMVAETGGSTAGGVPPAEQPDVRRLDRYRSRLCAAVPDRGSRFP
ncbi:hypothetical protein [Nonomuraea basaltis]|uniref:hypothetical protein n=1 Tax=Nonomuraea basaltis TaxID=2495887 RepID=UPI00110C4FE4|nr:hypothetical protein [Nonomuraea basaltis]TMR99120.1 hypothetical protein EJK15_09230 [Nonomuraea basaltis]